MPSLVKTSKHNRKFANTGKQDILDEFIKDYRDAVWFYVDYFWHNRVVWGDRILDVQKNKLDVPSYAPTIDTGISTDLSARALKRASKDALGIIKSRTEKRRKQLYVLAKLQRAGDTSAYKELQSKIDKTPLVKPSRKSLTSLVQLDSNCCTFIEKSSAEFDGFLKIWAIGKKYGHVYVPVKFTKHSKRLQNKGYSRITSWQITENSINSLWELTPAKSIGTKVLGANQGMTTCLSLSDGQTTPKCPHGHDLKSIIGVLKRKQRGSKSHLRDHKSIELIISTGRLTS